MHGMGGTFQAAAGFQDSDFIQKATKIALRCILSVNSHLSLQDSHFNLVPPMTQFTILIEVLSATVRSSEKMVKVLFKTVGKGRLHLLI